MTPADLCCGNCRSLDQCRRRCGVDPVRQTPALSRGMSARMLLLVDVLAIVILAALIAAPLLLTGHR